MLLYHSAVKVAKEFLGPAAEVFIQRQLSGHLNVLPLMLTTKDLPELAKWCKISAAMVTEPRKAEEFGRRIMDLGGRDSEQRLPIAPVR